MNLKRGVNKLKSIFKQINKRISLTSKMLIITAFVGLAMWIVFDLVQTRKLESIFLSQLTERLSKQAMEDRLSFDRYVKIHLHSIELFISQKNFSEYIEKQEWFSADHIKIKNYRRSPEWFPRSSVLRTFGQPRFVLLLDTRGRLREVYHGMHNNQLPLPLLHPTQQLILKSHGQHYMTDFDGQPYLIASERYLDSHGNVKATLVLASPIDDAFLADALGSTAPGHYVALLTPGENPRILTSSNLDEIPIDTPLNILKEHYLVTGQEYFDYGASEQAIKFISFISMKEVQTLIKSISDSERNIRIMALPVLITAFVLLMFWITRRIQLLTNRVSDFSQRTLGVNLTGLQRGDQLYVLEDRFHRLTVEILEARDVIRREAEDRVMLEKKNMEIKQRVKDFELLQSVTQAVGVGVIKKTLYGLESVNEQMEQYVEMCGGLSNFNAGDVEDMECSLLDINGDRRIFHISSPDIFKDEKIFLVRDITKIKEHTSALEHLAMHDTLTGLPNRVLLQDRLQQAIFISQRDSSSLALLMIDLDRFKEINDTLGHHIGDLVLREVGIRMSGLIRKSDTIARLGGDEFAAVLPSVDVEHAMQTAGKLLKALEKPLLIQGHSLFVEASIGMVFFPDHGDDVGTLLQRADVAMYVSKNTQCGLSIYSPDHDKNSLKHLVLTGELRCAIEKEDLMLYYQPKINCKSYCITGVEVLSRWYHAIHGFIPPDEFIPLAENTGLIKPLTLWVLNTALRQYVEWRREGIDIKIIMSVNLSTRNLQDPQFSNDVEKLLKKWDIEPACLEFEITESTVMANPESALKILKKLNAIGVRLSIDDFGTGYSSLAHLKKLPVDEIKIDRSFIVNMTTDESDAMIVRSTIDLAHNLGLSVTAEGVECQEVWESLEGLGCDEAQGHYMCHPISAEEFISWLKDTKWKGKKGKTH